MKNVNVGFRKKISDEQSLSSRMFKGRRTAQVAGLVTLLGFSGALEAVEPVSVDGNRVVFGGEAKSLAGTSLFWSNDGWGQEGFYSADTVSWLKNEWNSSIVRAAMGVDPEGGYLENPDSNRARVETVVNAAIANDMYVIIDWHTHHAENFTSDAVSFFQDMARKYGDSNNVIYEIYNEPLQVSWSGTIKPYAETVINAIRAIDPDNLIVVGTPNWSQGVKEASFDQISGTNIAYTLHFYAGTHHEWLRNDAREAMNNGAALFATEWGTVNANGDGGVNYGETDAWMSFLLDNGISHANWAVSNKEEGASIITGSGALTESGSKVKDILANWPNTLDTLSSSSSSSSSTSSSTSSSSSSSSSSTSGGTGNCTGVNTYPNWTAKDWDGGEYNHAEGGDQMVYQNALYTANWYTNSIPGSDGTWTLVGTCSGSSSSTSSSSGSTTSSSSGSTTSSSSGSTTSSSSGSTTSSSSGSTTSSSSGSSSSSSGGNPVDVGHMSNPFFGADKYVNENYSNLIDSSIAQVGDASLAAKMSELKGVSTAVWMDRIEAIGGGTDNADRLSLEEHLLAAVAQQNGNPMVFELVIYNLPNRDCAALASNGTLDFRTGGLDTYKTDYIDVIADLIQDPRFDSLRIVTVIEPDSLPNLITNLNGFPECAFVQQNKVYELGIQYAIERLTQKDNTYIYLDIGHSGWLGWETNLQPTVEFYTQVVSGANTNEGLSAIDGLITNVSNSTPTEEVFLDDSDLALNNGSDQIRSADFYEWNPIFDERDFANALHQGFVASGFPSDFSILIDTSRNGWGGDERPVEVSTATDVNDYVDESRLDRRFHRGNWCNPDGQGVGERPQVLPFGDSSPIEAFVWIKPPGESDGSSAVIDNNEGKGFDRMCDPTFITAAGFPTGALADAPVAGHWFHDQFVMLVENAYPVLGGGSSSSSSSSSTSTSSSSTSSSSSSSSGSTSSSSGSTTSSSTSTSSSSTSSSSSGGTDNCSGVNVYPNWTAKDWAGGEYNHAEAGDRMVYSGSLYSANWYTNSVPGSDGTWTSLGACGSSSSSSSSSGIASSSSSSTSSTSSSSSSTSSSSSGSSSSTSSSSSGGNGVFRVDVAGNITKDGSVLPVQCANWFGLEGRHEPSADSINPSGAPMELYVGNTFWANSGMGTDRTIQQTMSEIKNMGMNVIRFPIAPQTLDENDPQGMAPMLKNHPDVVATSARQQMEDFIKLADVNGLQVILDIHSCSNYIGWRAGRLDARPPYVDVDRLQYDFLREDSSCAATGNPAGVTRIQAYNKEIWLDNLRELAGLSEELGVSNILGIDVFNEPWDYSWAEWKELTEAAYVAINEVNPNVLVFVEGISDSYDNQDGTPEEFGESPHGDIESTPNWGENLFEMGTNPIDIPKDRLVLSPHTYGPSVFVQPMFMDPAQPECEGLKGDEAGDAKCNIVINPEILIASWEEHFGYLRDQGYAMVIGEYGGNMDWPDKAALGDQQRWGGHIEPGVDQLWQETLVDYMASKNIQGCYWGMNPESGDTGGWYEHSYDPVSNPGGWGEWLDFDPRKTNLLNRLWGQ